MDVSTLRGKNVLITGAASGIGKATALACARRGAHLFVCDLDTAGLEATADEVRRLGGSAVTRRVDVGDPAAMAAFADAVHGEVEAVDLLINNAGVAIGGGFLHTSLNDWNWITSINLMGVVYGCHFFLPRMVARHSGHVVNVASAAGLVANSALAAYCTTKFAVVGLSEALRDELAPHGIPVTAICPGLINTQITRSARLLGPDAAPEARERLVAIYERRNYTAERVADNILRAVQRNRMIAPISPEAWALYYLKRVAPGLVSWVGRRAERMRANP
jgi:NAD(P)-dependent dehydrogenase (short-subunit alcohol dehydrogenase family)